MTTALITGITGQDGAYLAKLLLEKGYRVVGGVRRNGGDALGRLTSLGIAEQVELLPFELMEHTNVLRVLEQVKPDEIYNLAAQSFVGVSFEQPLYTSEVTGLGALRLFEAARVVTPRARIYQASSSEMFGRVTVSPQCELTPFHPRSPYGVAKTFAHYSAVNYREAYDMHISCGIMFNHESPQRGTEFVTRKITRAAARIKLGLQTSLELGNLEACRDWGYAPDYVEAMWLMLQQETPDDYVIATGETHSVEEFVKTAFDFAQLDWRDYVISSPGLRRPADVELLCGASRKAEAAFGWVPQVFFYELVGIMTRADLQREGK
ncbi:hypothetical protein LCGC14_1632530 [marine sediment metagenome]|uniref:GDP-mannose 4,6-dehydratase n=1 Tax=marine sediment metagenome TaxID=412755 RepID=A0A0F9I276_9ZZZZ